MPAFIKILHGLLLLGLAYSAGLGAAPVMLVDSAYVAEPLENYVDVYVDNTGLIAAEDLVRPEYALNFSPLTSPRASFGFIDGALWCRLKMANVRDAADQYAMHFLPVNLSSLKVYEVSSETAGEARQIFAFDQRDGAMQHQAAPGFFVPLGGLNPGSSKQIIFRIQSDYPVDMDAIVYSSLSVGTDMQQQQSYYYFLFGCLWMVFLAAMVFLLYSANIIYLCYALYVLGVVGYFRSSWGFPSYITQSAFAYSGDGYFFFSSMISVFYLLTIIQLDQGTRYIRIISVWLFAVVLLNLLSLLGLVLFETKTSFYFFYGSALISWGASFVALIAAYFEKQTNYLLLFLIGAVANVLLAVASSITALVDLSTLVTGSVTLGFASTLVAVVSMVALGLYGAEKKESRRFSDLRASLSLKADQQKSALLNQMVSLVRSPTAAIAGVNGLLRNTSLTKTQQELMQASDDSAKRLLHTVEDFRAHAELELADAEARQVFSPLSMLDSLLLNLQPVILSRHIALKVEAPSDDSFLAEGQQQRIRHIFSSLLSERINNLRDTQLSLQLAVDSQFITLALTDHGTGWNGLDQQLDSAGVAAQQGEDLGHQRSAFLFGLPQVRQLVEKMGGDLTASFQAGGPLELVLKLPVNAAEDGISNTALSGQLHGLRVLLAHEDSVFRQLLERQFSGWGCDTEVCGTLSEAQAHLRLNASMKKEFQLVVLDRSLHQSSSPHFTERLRNDLHIASEPVALLMLSADFSIADTQLATDLGMQRVIAMPVDTRELKQIVLEEVFALQKHPQQRSNGNGAPTLKVMVLERDDLGAEVLKLRLRSLGIDEPVVCNPHGAMLTFQRQSFDVVLLHGDLANHDTLEWVEMVRRWESESSRTPAFIIGLATFKDDTLIERASAAGINAHLLRPVYAHELQALLDTHFG